MAVIVGMTTSLDGFIHDRNGSASALYPDLAELSASGYLGHDIERTGAVVMGRRTYEMADPDSYLGNYEFQVPIFVVTHEPPAAVPKQDDRLSFTFVTGGIESAVAQATTAAGDRDVTVVGGASVIQQLLRAGLVDELHLDIMPVLLGGGLRLLEQLPAGLPRLEKIDVREHGARTGLRFRVVKDAKVG